MNQTTLKRSTAEWREMISRRTKEAMKRPEVVAKLHYKRSPEQIEKLRLSHLGQKPWNKGLKGFGAGHSVPGEVRKKIGMANKQKWLDNPNLKEERYAIRLIHDRVLLDRLRELHRLGAQIVFTNWATRHGESVPDIIYLLKDRVVHEDVKYTGDVQVEKETNIVSNGGVLSNLSDMEQ